MAKKFPFSSYKVSELPHCAQELTSREKFRRAEKNPTMFRGFERSNTYQDPGMLHLSSTKAPRKSSDPTLARTRPLYERRQFDREKKAALQQAAKPNLAENEFLNHFEEFSRAIAHFEKNGPNWPKPQGLVLRVDEILQIKTHEEWLEWILQVKTKNGADYNWFHPSWCNSLMRQQFSQLTEVETARIQSFNSTFLEFTKCQQHRHKVS